MIISSVLLHLEFDMVCTALHALTSFQAHSQGASLKPNPPTFKPTPEDPHKH